MTVLVDENTPVSELLLLSLGLVALLISFFTANRVICNVAITTAIPSFVLFGFLRRRTRKKNSLCK